jgi:hypothetical protein
VIAAHPNDGNVANVAFFVLQFACPGTGNYTRHLTEGKYKYQSRNITGLLSDSGGGIPAAAKVLLEVRRPCTMHTVDTAVGWAMGEKGKKPKSDEE